MRARLDLRHPRDESHVYIAGGGRRLLEGAGKHSRRYAADRPDDHRGGHFCPSRFARARVHGCSAGREDRREPRRSDAGLRRRKGKRRGNGSRGLDARHRYRRRRAFSVGAPAQCETGKELPDRGRDGSQRRHSPLGHALPAEERSSGACHRLRRGSGAAQQFRAFSRRSLCDPGDRRADV